MWQINFYLEIAALVMVIANAAIVLSWMEKQTIKTIRVQRNLAIFYKGSAIFMGAAIIINAIFMKINGQFGNPFIALLYITGYALFAYEGIRKLRKNYLDRVKVGAKHPFAVVSVGDKISGYVVIGGTWIAAEAVTEQEGIEENTSVFATLTETGLNSKDKRIMVRI